MLQTTCGTRDTWPKASSHPNQASPQCVPCNYSKDTSSCRGPCPEAAHASRRICAKLTLLELLTSMEHPAACQGTLQAMILCPMGSNLTRSFCAEPEHCHVPGISAETTCSLSAQMDTSYGPYTKVADKCL